MGIAMAPNGAKLHRRIDIQITPYENWGAALMHYTGSADFNIRMRTIAISKGFLLNEKGLFRGDVKIPTTSEASIFELLDVPYVSPSERGRVAT
jgi:DNA polymerase/3'-5' exonuclease PolX